MAVDSSLQLGTKWDQFIYWCGRFLETEEFVRDEREYKLPVAARVVAARNALLAGDEAWIDLLHHAIVDKPNNLTSWRQTQPMVAWFRSDPDSAGWALRLLWNETLPVRERFSGFDEILQAHGVKAPIAETSFLHMAMGIEEFPPFRSVAMDKAMGLTKYASPKDTGIKTGDIGGRYQHFLRFLDTMHVRGGERGLMLRDRLDAQGVVWIVTQWHPIDLWPPDDQEAFHAYLGSTVHRKESSEKPA